MMAPVVIAIGFAFFVVILQKDLFLKWALSVRGAKRGTSPTKRKLKVAWSTLLTVVMLYMLQSAVVVLALIVQSVWGIKRSCNDFDAQLVPIGKYVCYAFVVLLLYFSILVFAGIRDLSLKGLTIGWLNDARKLLMLTGGVWTPGTVEKFEVVARADKFNRDEYDNESAQEMVMKLQGQSRGLMWMAVPYGVLLTKLCEAVNHPPIFVFGQSHMPYSFNMATPFKVRFILWFLAMLKFAFNTLVVFIGSVPYLDTAMMVYIAMGTTVVATVAEVIVTGIYLTMKKASKRSARVAPIKKSANAEEYELQPTAQTQNYVQQDTQHTTFMSTEQALQQHNSQPPPYASPAVAPLSPTGDHLNRGAAGGRLPPLPNYTSVVTRDSN